MFPYSPDPSHPALPMTSHISFRSTVYVSRLSHGSRDVRRVSSASASPVCPRWRSWRSRVMTSCFAFLIFVKHQRSPFFLINTITLVRLSSVDCTLPTLIPGRPSLPVVTREEIVRSRVMDSRLHTGMGAGDRVMRLVQERWGLRVNRPMG